MVLITVVKQLGKCLPAEDLVSHMKSVTHKILVMKNWHLYISKLKKNWF